ncbi:MAG: hypothetical protein HQL78_06925 [Magnetococcales bacterium]|nr:hypothetical protein [Magnetococcales bacterium]MBF0419884.1 hypothetical protein [Magnetococcales bacterium]
MNKIVILSGPGCVGKKPLFSAFRRFHPETASRFRRLVLFNDRPPHPGEDDGTDYHFRSRMELESMRFKEGFIVADVRGNLQALEIRQIQTILDDGNIPYYEGNPFVPAKLWDEGILERFPHLSVFLSPLSKEEIVFLKSPERRVDLSRFVREVQRRKLLRREATRKQWLSLHDLEEIEHAAGSAYLELREAWKFQHILVSYDTGDGDNWDAFHYPLGNARKTLLSFAALLAGERAVEDDGPWPHDLLP